jgi:tetratricopeptide (TPR) repeat protein
VISIILLFSLLAAEPQIVQQSGTNSATEKTANPAASVEKEYEKLLEDDDIAQQEVDTWIQENGEHRAKGAGTSDAELNHRIQERFAPIRKAYESFIQRHPDHSKARIAYGSFLGDINEEDAAQVQYEKALELDPKNPAIYNNLANTYGHHGPVKKSFEYYAKAIELNPKEPVYFHNFGTTVFLFRKDAQEFYGIDEQEVFNKALTLYSNSMRLDPTNFPLASDIAQTYYGIKPPRYEQALNAWTNALNLAHDEIEREGVHIHFARVNLEAGNFNEARAHLSLITNQMYLDLKNRISRNLEERQKGSTATNSAPQDAQAQAPPATARPKNP